MVAFASKNFANNDGLWQSAHEPSGWEDRFLEMLPTIKRQARFAVRKLRSSQREEALQEVIASVYVAYAALVRRDKESIAYPTPLVRFAIAQYYDGRRLGSRLNVNDIMSPHCQKRRGICQEIMDREHSDGCKWQEWLIEDGRSTPADIAATRVDFCDWLESLPLAKRHLTVALASGDSTKEAASKFSISEARVSQVRLELKKSWSHYQGIAC